MNSFERFSLTLTLTLTLTLFPRVGAAQHFSLALSHPGDSVKVGEAVEFDIRVHIGPQQRLASPVPLLIGELPDGVRMLGFDSLTADSTRTLLKGKARFAFYRPGQVPVPPLRLVLRAIASDRGQPLEHDPLSIIVGSSLPPGNPSLKDIRDRLPRVPLNPWAVAAAGAVLAVVALVIRPLIRAGRRRPAPSLNVAVPVPLSALEEARAELQALAGDLDQSDIETYYAAVIDVLRRYFVAVAPETSPAQTSRELLRVLAARNGNSAWHGTESVLLSADLVKFAGVMPDRAAARRFTDQVQRVLESWRFQSAGGAE